MKNNKSILWKWTLSYLCLLFIPLLSVFINYTNNVSSSKKEYEKTYELTLENLISGIDAQIYNIRNFYYYILDNDSFNSLKTYQVKNSHFYFDSYLFQTSLATYRTANTALDCTVYFPHLDFVSSSKNSCKNVLYYNYLQNSSGQLPAYEEWLQFMTNNYNEDYLIHTALSLTKSPCLMYAHTISRGISEPLNIFINVPLDEIYAMTRLLSSGNYFVIQTTDNHLYCLNNEGQFATDMSLSLDENNRLVSSPDYVCITAPANESKLTYYLLITKDVFNANLSGIHKNFAVTLIITLFLSIVGVISLLHINYRPISELLTKFNIARTKNNEFASIAASYEKLRTDYHSTQLTVQQQNRDLLNSWLLSLLKGRINELDLQQKKTHFEIAPDSQIALIGFMIPPINDEDIEYDELLYFIVDNVFSDLFADYTFYHIEDGCFIFYLFDLENTDVSAWRAFAFEKTTFLCNFLSEKCSLDIVGVVSTPAEDLSRCKFLYREVMEAFEIHNMSGGERVIDTMSLNSHPSFEYIREIIEVQLNNAVKSGNLQEALSISTQLFSENHEMPLHTVKLFSFDAFTMIIETFSTYIDDPIHRINALNFFGPLMQSTDTKELIHCFHKFLTFICGEISKELQLTGNDIVLKIKNYITANYADQNLSVSSIADTLGRNPKYITRVFKDGTGEGILDYINHYRISQAYEIMQSRKYTLEEISEMVGYANIQAFRRAFVKLTGENPSKFNK